jgi:ribosomal protein L29
VGKKPKRKRTTHLPLVFFFHLCGVLAQAPPRVHAHTRTQPLCTMQTAASALRPAAPAARPAPRLAAAAPSGRRAPAAVVAAKPTKAADFRSLSDEDIKQQVADGKKALFKLRMAQKTRQVRWTGRASN